MRSIMRKVKQRGGPGWSPFSSGWSLGGLANNSPPRLHAPRPPDQEKLVTDSSDSPTTCAAPPPPRFPGRQTPAPVPPGAATGSFPFQSTSSLSDRSRGTRLQAHVVQNCWCNPAPKPSSRHGRVERTFRTAWGTRSRPGLPQLPHTRREWHLLRRLWISSEWLAPPDFQAIAKHTRSTYRITFSAATVPNSFPKSETTSHTVTAQLASPLLPPLLPPLRAPGISRGTHALCDAARPRARLGGAGGGG